MDDVALGAVRLIVQTGDRAVELRDDFAGRTLSPGRRSDHDEVVAADVADAEIIRVAAAAHGLKQDFRSVADRLRRVRTRSGR